MRPVSETAAEQPHGRPSVVTVRGPIDPADLGVTLSHDHLIMDGWDIFKSYAVIFDDEATVTNEIRAYRAAGGRAIADPTNLGLDAIRSRCGGSARPRMSTS